MHGAAIPVAQQSVDGSSALAGPFFGNSEEQQSCEWLWVHYLCRDTSVVQRRCVPESNGGRRPSGWPTGVLSGAEYQRRKTPSCWGDCFSDKKAFLRHHELRTRRTWTDVSNCGHEKARELGDPFLAR